MRGADAGLTSAPVPFAFPSTQTRQFYVSIQPPVGELMAPVFMSENEFKKEQGECSLVDCTDGWEERQSMLPTSPHKD